MHIDISDVARVMAALSPDEWTSLDARVDKLKRDEAFLKEQAIAELRAMSDNEVIVRALNAGKSAGEVRHGDPTLIDIDELLRVLCEAGFVRPTGPLPNHARENRWEVGVRNIVHHLHGPRHEFEIYDIVEEVRELAEARSRNAKVDLPEAVTRVRETINEIEFMVRKGIPISNAPSLKHWLLRGLDAFTGENHSGCATSLPQPKTRLV